MPAGATFTLRGSPRHATKYGAGTLDLRKGKQDTVTGKAGAPDAPAASGGFNLRGLVTHHSSGSQGPVGNPMTHHSPAPVKLGKKGQAKVEKVMGEMKAGTLHSGSKTGPKVTSRKQAIKIALSEGRKASRGGYY